EVQGVSSAICDEADADCSDAIVAVAPQAVSDPEYITIEEVQRLQRVQSGFVVVDARTERTYNERTETIPGSIRLHPDNAVRSAEQQQLAKAAILAVICA